DPLAGAEQDPVLGHESPDHRAAQADQRQDADTEAQELGEPVVRGAVVRVHDAPPGVMTRSGHSGAAADLPRAGGGLLSGRRFMGQLRGIGKAVPGRTLSPVVPISTRFELLRCYQRIIRSLSCPLVPVTRSNL